ncbi:hypothetical protein F4808DRAFT_217797 [Astrocystis sublimbata]|nr:hypothetical protein F4808DRAFT_217797 [Astrocystis sublimbata]
MMSIPNLMKRGYLLLTLSATTASAGLVSHPNSNSKSSGGYGGSECTRNWPSAPPPFITPIPIPTTMPPVEPSLRISSLTSVSSASLWESDSESGSQTLPGSCYTTWDDFEHSTAGVKTHECYTRTVLVPPASCPPLTTCPPRASDQVCPLYIKVSSITVPCATDCCPTTSTVFAESTPAASASASTLPTPFLKAATSGACPTCEKCPIPTEWITYTTGCVGTPTITKVTIVTPS